MGDLRDLAINLAATAIAFGIGFSVRSLFRLVRTRQARRFWAPVVKDGGLFVLGHFSSELEPAGLVGVGDARAFQELAAHFTDLKVRYQVTFANKLADQQLRNNLIILGGGDSNEVSQRLMADIASGFEFGHDPADGVIVRDTGSGERFVPQRRESGEVTRDYGILIRVASPFNPSRTAVVIAGAYGFGSWSGVRLVQDPDFLRYCRDFREFACVFQADVLQGFPQHVVPVSWHSIERAPPKPRVLR
ncbi:MAG TPA: hypothetical protein VF755_07100 [Catenuloplanes sp.]|jgi:hypothetical protein